MRNTIAALLALATMTVFLVPSASAKPVVGPIDIAGVRVEVHRYSDHDAWGRKHDGTAGNLSYAPAGLNLTFVAKCGTDPDSTPYNHRALCEATAGGHVLGDRTDAWVLCGGQLANRSSKARDELVCLVAAGYIGQAALAAVVCIDDPTPSLSLEGGASCAAVALLGSHSETARWQWTDAIVAFATSDPRTTCVSIYDKPASEPRAVACSPEVALCFQHNPRALTNACLEPEGANATTPTANPTASPPAVVPGGGICVLGPICLPAVSGGGVDPGLGTEGRKVPSGYLEATALCGALPAPCRVAV